MTTGVAKIVKTSIGGETEDIGVLAAFGGEEVFIETKDLDFGTESEPTIGEADKMIEGIIIDCTERSALSTMSIYIGTRQRHNDTLTWHGPFSASTQDAATYFSDVPESRYHRLKIVDSLPTAVWKISRIEFYGEVMGQRL